MMNTKVRILLLQSVAPRVSTSPPLGLAYLGAVLERAGCEVRIIDAAAPYANYSIDDLVREAREFAPHIIGVTTFVNFIRFSYLLLEALAKAKLGALLVAGGPHATILAQEPLEHAAEVVVRGEAEETILELVEHVLGKRELGNILGISYRNANGDIVHNSAHPMIQDLDTVPMPAKHLFRERDYVRHGEERERFGNIFTSRGCPFGCTYCSRSVFARRFRFHSPERVMREIELLNRQYGINRFRFIDDAFTTNKKRVSLLCQGIIESGLKISWVCETRLNCLDERLLAEMKQAGCRTVVCGIESGNPETLRRINKGFTTNEAKQAVHMIHAAGLNCSCNFMTGFPWETAGDIRVTRDFLKEISPHVTVFAPAGILIPIPGTEIYSQYKDEFGLDRWWLDALGSREERAARVRPPLFEAIYYNLIVLDKNFFHYAPDIVREIERTADDIGMHNMRFASQLVKRGLPFPVPVSVVARVLVLLCKLSRRLYKISPKIERALMKPFLNAAEKYQHLN